MKLIILPQTIFTQKYPTMNFPKLQYVIVYLRTLLLTLGAWSINIQAIQLRPAIVEFLLQFKM